jgi:hypothetical protein
MLVGSYLSQTLVQGLMALPSAGSFGAMLALTVAASVVITPASIIADAAVMAASTHASGALLCSLLLAEWQRLRSARQECLETCCLSLSAAAWRLRPASDLGQPQLDGLCAPRRLGEQHVRHQVGEAATAVVHCRLWTSAPSWLSPSLEPCRVGIVCFVVGSLLALPAAWMLPVEALRRKVSLLAGRLWLTMGFGCPWVASCYLP